jgi:hypothetical protein
MEEDEHGLPMKDASGSFVCGIPHRKDLHRTNYQYAKNFLSREEARRIAKTISRLPELLKRPPNRQP